MPRSINDAREAVLAEREQVAASVREMEGRLKELDAVLASLDRLTGGAPARPARRTTAKRGAARASSNGRSGGRRAGSMASTIEQFLQEQGRKATHMDQIMEYLQQVKRAPGGKNPKGSLRTTLYQLEKGGRIRNVGRNRWRAGKASRATKAAAATNSQS